MAIVAHDGEKLYLVRQPREPVGAQALLELPAGKFDEEGEDVQATAERELAEEIGKGARTWEHLTTFFTTPASPTRRCTSTWPRISTTRRPRPTRTSGSRSSRCRWTSSTTPSASARTGRACGPSLVPRLPPLTAALQPQGMRAARPNAESGWQPSLTPASSKRFEDLLLDFLAYLEFERGLSRNTLEAYRTDLLQFGRFLAERTLDAAEASAADVSDFLTHLATGNGKAASPATIHRKAACLRSFYRHLRREGIRDSDPTATLTAPRRGRKLPQVLTRARWSACCRSRRAAPRAPCVTGRCSS